MKILQINNCHYRRGGADVVYLNTGELLAKNGHEVFYFSQRNQRNLVSITEPFFVEQVDFFNKSIFKKILFMPRFIYSNESYININKLIDSYTPDIAHIHTYKGNLTPSILKALKNRKIPVVITLHDYGLLCPHNSFLNGKGEICTKCYDTGNTFNCILNRCNRNSIILSSVSFLEYNIQKYLFPFHLYFDHLITVCKFSLDLHSKLPHFKTKISQLYNFTPLAIEGKTDFKHGGYLLFYGRLSSEKGLRTLITAFSDLSLKIELKIVGDGPIKEELINFSKERNLANIHFLGFLQNEELEEIIRNSFYVIIPSEWNENNPMTIVEAYSFNKPVIASSIGGIPEVVLDGVTGYLFDTFDSVKLKQTIEKAVSISENEYELLCENTKKFAEENFSEDQHYKKLLNIYEKIIKMKKNEI